MEDLRLIVTPEGSEYETEIRTVWDGRTTCAGDPPGHPQAVLGEGEDPQQLILGDRQHEPTCKAGRRPPAERETKVMDNMIETRRPACPWGKHVSVEALGENALPAQNGPALEPTRPHHQANQTSHDRQASQASMISAMEPARSGPTSRADVRGLDGANGDQRARAVARGLVDDKTVRNKSKGAKRLRHGIELPR